MGLYRTHGVWYRPTTNASLLTVDKMDIMDGVCDWLKCSFDAAEKNLYHRLYLKDNFSRVSENLKLFGKYREKMRPMPWFRVGLVLMRSNLNHLIEYADYCNQELGVDDIEIMGLNFANREMSDEFYWDIPAIVDKKIEELIEHCEKNNYRMRLPFINMGTSIWYGGKPCSDITEIDRTYSNEVKRGDIFGNKEQMEPNYIWSNHLRVSEITADDGTQISGICDFWVRNFLKPPEFQGGPLYVTACGSCSTFRFGDLKKKSFKEIYNNDLFQKVREFMYNKINLPRSEWPIPCKKCLCVDAIYSKENNGPDNVGKFYDCI
jgi:MoaA/NifB/PqqE/SkfB family radical SAM enzyme